MCYYKYMENPEKEKLIKEQQEKKAIELENKILSYLMPAVGLAALFIGIVGFVAAISDPNGLGSAIFLMILAVLGAGGIAYGVVAFIKKRNKKYRKEESVPSDEPNA